MKKLFRNGIRIRTINAIVILLAVAFSFLLFLSTSGTLRAYEQEAVATETFYSCERAANDLMEASNYLTTQVRLFAILLLAVIVFTIFLVEYLILIPLKVYIKKIKASEPLPERGARELRYLSRAYNDMYEETKKANESLRHAAEHDALTRLYNRRAFDALAHQFRDGIALMILDIDGFKGFNDTYGHDVGDKLLQKVARLLKASFRFSDYICRFGGDEFTIIMTDMNPELRSVIESKVAVVRKGLLDTSDGLPKVTLSIGVSFGNGESADEIFKAADNALYDVKDRGRNGMSFNVRGEIIPVK